MLQIPDIIDALESIHTDLEALKNLLPSAINEAERAYVKNLELLKTLKDEQNRLIDQMADEHAAKEHVNSDGFLDDEFEQR